LSKIFKASDVTIDRDNVVMFDSDAADKFEDTAVEDSIAVEQPKESPEQQAEKIIRQAQREAESIIRTAKQNAEAEAEAIADQAYEQGYQEGMDLAAAEGDAIKAQAQKVVLDAWEERKTLLNKLEPEIVELIIRITGKLLDDSIELNPKLIVVLIKQGLSGSNLTGEVIVHVSGADYDAAVECKDELHALTDSSTRLEIMKDPSLKPMDCIIETPYGDVDCSLNQGFEAIVKNLKYRLNNN
jgi:flagellar assembly protein FliH